MDDKTFLRMVAETFVTWSIMSTFVLEAAKIMGVF
jgi:hypothetical protein